MTHVLWAKIQKGNRGGPSWWDCTSTTSPTTDTSTATTSPTTTTAPALALKSPYSVSLLSSSSSIPGRKAPCLDSKWGSGRSLYPPSTRISYGTSPEKARPSSQPKENGPTAQRAEVQWRQCTSFSLGPQLSLTYSQLWIKQISFIFLTLEGFYSIFSFSLNRKRLHTNFTVSLHCSTVCFSLKRGLSGRGKNKNLRFSKF